MFDTLSDLLISNFRWNLARSTPMVRFPLTVLAANVRQISTLNVARNYFQNMSCMFQRCGNVNSFSWRYFGKEILARTVGEIWNHCKVWNENSGERNTIKKDSIEWPHLFKACSYVYVPDRVRIVTNTAPIRSRNFSMAGEQPGRVQQTWKLVRRAKRRQKS